MFCTNCGKEVADGNAFCTWCGARMDIVAQPPKQAPGMRKINYGDYSPRRTPSVPKSNVKGFTLGALVALLGSVLTIFSVFLPAVTASAFGFSQSSSLAQEFARDDTPLITAVIIGVFVFAGIIAVLAHMLGHRRLSLIGGVIALIVSIFMFYGIYQGVQETYGVGHVAFGMYVMVAGGLIVFISAFLPPRKLM